MNPKRDHFFRSKTELNQTIKLILYWVIGYVFHLFRHTNNEYRVTFLFNTFHLKFLIQLNHVFDCIIIKIIRSDGIGNFFFQTAQLFLIPSNYNQWFVQFTTFIQKWSTSLMSVGVCFFFKLGKLRLLNSWKCIYAQQINLFKVCISLPNNLNYMYTFTVTWRWRRWKKNLNK